MPKVKISEFSSTPGNNTDIDGINIAENCAPSGINDAIRELMAQLKDWQAGTSNDPYVVGSSGSLTLSYGTANGVPYLNGSKVLTTGSALTFDGTNLGIGNSNPTEKLEVVNTSGAVTARIWSSTNTSPIASLEFQRGTNATWGADAYGDYRIRNDTGALLFQYGENGTTTERMRLNSSGNVGIGTAAPLTALNVNGTGGELIRISVTSDGATQQEPALGFATGVTNTYPAAKISALEYDASDSRASLLFYTRGDNTDSAPTERMRIDSSGNVGIGTSSPDSYNVLGGTIAAVAGSGISNLSIVSGASSTGNILFADGTSGDERRAGRIAYDHSVNNLYFFTNGNSLRATIDSSGNLGLGVTPSAWSSSVKALEIGRIGNGFVGLTSGSNSYVSAGAYFDGTWKYSHTGVAAGMYSASSAHAWYTAPSGTAGNAITFTQAMTLDASGNLGIGTTSPTFTSGSGLEIERTDATSTIRLQRAGTSPSSMEIRSGANTGEIIVTSNSALLFGTNGTERMRLDSSGNLQMQAGAVMPYAPAPASISTTATLTNANIQGQIINTTGTSYTVTMPLGTTLETLASWATTSVAYDFYVINTASGTITMAVNTGVTSLGGLTIATGVSAHFRIRRTAANTFVLYRLV